jgi:hypothetical protein
LCSGSGDFPAKMSAALTRSIAEKMSDLSSAEKGSFSCSLGARRKCPSEKVRKLVGGKDRLKRPKKSLKMSENLFENVRKNV